MTTTFPETTALARTSPPPSYADLDTWRRYQGFFPPAMRCTPETTPTEEWWGWNGLDVRSPRPT